MSSNSENDPSVPNPPVESNQGTNLPAPINVPDTDCGSSSTHTNDISPTKSEEKLDNTQSSPSNLKSDELVVEMDSPQKKTPTCLRILYSMIPITEWLPKYKKEYFSFDLIAGLTVGIMAIPQGMAYAMLANLPPIYGLYACIVPVFMYAILGTSRHVHIGPFALVSMMVSSALSYINPDEDLTAYIGGMTTLSLCCGIVFLVLGICRGGVVTRLLSETIVTAFTTASAFNIGGSQLKHLWGVSCSESVFFKIVYKLFFTELRNSFNWWAFLIGSTATLILYTMKWLNKKYLPKKPLPVELFLVILYIFVMWAFDLKHRWNLKYLGDYDIVRGMPPITIPDMKNLDKLIPSAIMICIVDYVITVSLGKIFARRFSYHLDPNQELVALGGANIVGSFFSCYPPAGSLSRSALVANCEARTSLHNFISPLLIILCLYLLTDIIIYIPNASLAAIVIVNLFSLFAQFAELGPMWKTSWADFGCFIVCTICTITLGTEAGLIGGVLSSFIFLLIAYFMNKPKVENTEDLKSLSVDDNYVVISSTWNLQFINRDTYRNRIDAVPKNKKIIFDLRRVVYIDCSAIMMLQEVVKQHNDGEEKLFILCRTQYLEDKLKAYGDDKIHLYKSVEEIVSK